MGIEGMWLGNLPDYDNLEQEMVQKRIIVKVLFVAGIPIIVYNMMLDFMNGTCVVSCLLLALLLILLTLLIILPKQTEEKREYQVYQFFMSLFILLFGILLIYAVGIQREFTRLHWSYFYPILVFFSLGGRAGLPWVVLFYIIAAPLLFFFDPSPVNTGSLWEIKVRFLFSFFFISVFSFLLEQYIRRSQKELLSNQDRLKKSEKLYRDAYERLISATQERKKVEEEKLQLEAQVLQAQKMEAIYTLAGGVAHDFNNLLMAIKGNLSLVVFDLDSKHPQYERLQVVEKLIHSGAELTKQLLDFAKGSAYRTEPIDMNKLIDKSSSMFNRAEKGIRIHKNCARDAWTVEVDPGQIEQVMMNLYINAWQAMAEQGEIYLETENVVLDDNFVKPYGVNPGNYLRISVTDTGGGMDEATQRRVFEPFFTTKDKDRGTGLGLASAYSIITKHGGIINLHSEKGIGTTFNVYLPASEKRAVIDERVAGETLSGSETILLVDDEDMIIDVFEDILKSLGYQVMTAQSGKDAIEIYKQNGPEIAIVVLDMIMPDMGGAEAYKHLKAINPNIKVLLATGYSINEKISGILKKDGNGFIQKPFSIAQLSQSIRRILDSQQAEAAA